MKERRSDEATMSGINQLIAPDEIKQEPDIKEEPMADGDLVEFPAIINEGIGQPYANPYRYNGEGAVVNLPPYEVKVEVKPERTATKEKENETKVSGRNEGALNNHPLGQIARNLMKPNKSNAEGSASKAHRCDQCGYMVRCKAHLETHLLTHTGKKPFPCSHCPKEFTQKRYLQNHMKMHVEEFLFSCAVCLEGFDQQVRAMFPMKADKPIIELQRIGA